MAIFTAIPRLKIRVERALIISRRESAGGGLEGAAEERGVEATRAGAVRLEAEEEGGVREDTSVRLGERDWVPLVRAEGALVKEGRVNGSGAEIDPTVLVVAEEVGERSVEEDPLTVKERRIGEPLLEDLFNHSVERLSEGAYDPLPAISIHAPAELWSTTALWVPAALGACAALPFLAVEDVLSIKSADP